MVKPGRPRKTSPSNRSHEFFKVYLPDRSSQQLKIPPAFVKHFKGDLPCNSVLKGPTRRAWCVNVKKVDDSLYFNQGWQAFVEDNSLEFGDFLVFRYSYDGTSKFSVKIYGINGCEKQDATTEKQQRVIREDNEELPCNEVKQEYVDEGDLNGLVHRMEARPVNTRGNIVIHTENDFNGDETGIPTPKSKFRARGSKLVQGNQRTREGKFKQLSRKECAFRRVTRQSSRSRVDMATKKKDRAPKEVNKFSFKHPHFEVFMRSSYVNKGILNVPASFMKKYMKKEREVVTLLVSKRSWHVTLKSYKNISWKFSAGWYKFVRENKLQEGNVCAFELIKTNDIVLKVSIRR